MPQNSNGKVYYEADRIIDEKLIGDDWYYYIKWKGMDENGKPWSPTWEPSSYCTPPLIASWEQQKRSAKRKLRSPMDSTSKPSSTTSTMNTESKKGLSGSSKDDLRSLNSPTMTGGNARIPMVVGPPELLLGGSFNLPMVIEDVTPRSFPLNNGSSSRLRSQSYGGISMEDSTSKKLSDDSNLSQLSKKSRFSQHLRTIMIPIPLSLLQQKIYRAIFNKPQLFRAFAEADESLPLSSDSLILTARDQLLMLVDHISLFTQTLNDNRRLFKKWLSDVSMTGKLLMLRRLLMKLSHKNIKIGIALPQGKMIDIFKDFLELLGHNYLEAHDSKSKNVSRASDLNHNYERMTCILFSTSAHINSYLSSLDLVIAYDTSFNPSNQLWNSKSNVNIPVIRLVTKNTLEHALSYQLFYEKKVISELNLSDIKKMMLFGVIKKNQTLIPGCETSKFDVNGVCDKVVSWIESGMHEDLTFGMETAIEKAWGKVVPSLVSSRVSEKRHSEVLDDTGAPKRRKQEKEPAQIEEGSTSKSKKIKRTSNDDLEKITKRESLKPASKALRDNLERNVKHDPSDDMADGRKDSLRPAIEKISGQLPGSTSNKYWISPFEENGTTENLKQKILDLQFKSKSHEETISGLQQERDRYLGLVNELSAELSSTRTQLLESQAQARRLKSQYEASDSEVSQELTNTQEKLTEALRTISKTKIDMEAKEAENVNMKKEVEESKSTIRSMKVQLKVLQEESAALRFQLRTDFPGKSTRRTETLDEQVKMLTAENNSLRMQCELFQKQSKMAEENATRNKDLVNLLLKFKGKNLEDVEKYLEERHGEMQDGVNESVIISDESSNRNPSQGDVDPLSTKPLTNGSLKYAYGLDKCKNKFRAIEYANADESQDYWNIDNGIQ
ncbi:3198_t:CDS:2 [Acaulospora morrowiae]|uniref:3198_t:CDS:1 n=1 Tax=Acaulospora morrowiae TaxID=94023 RepID=A0A9N8V909_9GLOM|nr:3198_t:CDS:2 [Acaulospora morrowiae]